MVGGVRVDVLVVNLRARTDHECAAELGDSLAALLHAKTIPVGAPCSLEASRIEEQRGEVDLSDGGGVRGVGGIVDEDGKRNLLVGNERLGVVLVAGANGDDFRTGPGDLVVGAAQLRGMFSTEQSAEVTQKDQDYRTLSPEVAQPVTATVGTDEFDLLQALQIHGDNMPHRG